MKSPDGAMCIFIDIVSSDNLVYMLQSSRSKRPSATVIWRQVITVKFLSYTPKRVTFGADGGKIYLYLHSVSDDSWLNRTPSDEHEKKKFLKVPCSIVFALYEMRVVAQCVNLFRGLRRKPQLQIRKLLIDRSMSAKNVCCSRTYSARLGLRMSTENNVNEESATCGNP